jgi:hypothetical protein
MTERFDPVAHAYYLDDVRVPSVTQMLHAEGLIDPTWFTEDARERGSAVHELTARMDLGALEVDEYEGLYAGYLQAHHAAMAIIRPEHLHVEVALVHRQYRYGTRLDRLSRMWSRLSVTELKTGAVAEWHGIQTALQAIAAQQETGVPATSIARYGLYLKANGKFKLERFEALADFGKALKVIRNQACRTQAWEPIEAW